MVMMPDRAVTVNSSALFEPQNAASSLALGPDDDDRPGYTGTLS